MMNALKEGVVDFTPSDDTAPRLGKAERDAEICRLWQAQWTAKKIAEHLDVTKSTVNNVVYKNGLNRKPRRNVETVALADAPIEAWRAVAVAFVAIALLPVATRWVQQISASRWWSQLDSANMALVTPRLQIGMQKE